MDAPQVQTITSGRDLLDLSLIHILITGVTASVARDRSYELTFTAIPYSERYGYRPALIPCPVMAGTLPALSLIHICPPVMTCGYC